LIAVADAVGGGWPERARVAGVALVADSKDAEPSLGIRLLHDLRAVFGDAKEMSSKSILRALHAIEEGPWADMKGKPLDERGLSHRLRQYGIRSKTVRTEGGTPKGYTRADLLDQWTRYLPPYPAISATSATSATSMQNGGTGAPQPFSADSKEASQINDVADVADVALPGGMRRVCAHCDKSDGELREASVGGWPIWLHPACTQAYRP
jgi:hypothetical protein